MGAASHLQETFTDAHISVTSLLAELKSWAEQCSDIDRTKWLSKKVYRDALAARLQQVCTACKQAMKVKTAADRDGEVLQQLEALRCLISLIPQETGQQLAQHLLYKTNLLDSLSAMMELLPQLADLYTDHTSDTDDSHNKVISQLVSTGRFVLAAVQDMANYTYPAVAAAPSQMGGSLASKNALVTGREACGPKLLKSVLLMTNMDTRVTCCYFSLRRSAVSLLRELVTCCRRNQRLLLQDYSAEYKQLMCEVLPSCGDQPTQADLFEVLYRCAKVFGEQVYQHCLGAQMRGQMAQLLAQDSADLDLSSELSKMVVAYNISLQDKASVMLVEAQMLRLSAPLLQPVGHQVPLGPHHISLPILLQQDDDEPEPEILDISYNNISRVIVTPAAVAQHPDLAQPGQQLVEMQCKTFPACLGEDVKRACEEAAAGAAAGAAGSIAAASRRDADVFSLGMVLLDNHLNRLLKVLRAKDIIVKTHSPALQENSGIQSQGQTQRRKMSIGTMPSSYHKPPLHFSKSTPASSLHPRALTFTKSTAAAAAAAGQQITPPLPLPPAAAGSGTARRQQPQPQTMQQLVSTTPLPAKSAAPGKDAAAAATAAEAADDDSNAAAAAAAAMAAAFAPSPSKQSLLAASSDTPDSADSDDSKTESQSQSGQNVATKPAEKEPLIMKSRKRNSRTVTGRVSLDSYEQMDFVAATAEDGDAQDAGDNPSAAAAAVAAEVSLQAVADEEDEAAVTGDTRSPQARSKETGPASPLIDLVAVGPPDKQQQQHARQQQQLRAATESLSLSLQQQQQQQRQDEQQQADQGDVLQKVEKKQQQIDATGLQLDGNSSENGQEQQDCDDDDDDNSPATAGLQQLPLLPSSKQQTDTKAHKRYTAATPVDATATAAATAVQQVRHKQIQQPLFSDVRKVHQRKGQQAPLQSLLHEPQQQQQQQEHKQQQQVDDHTAADDQYMFSPEDDNDDQQAGSSNSSSDQDSDYVAGRAKRAARGRRRTAGAAAGGSRPTSRLAGMKRKAAAAAAAGGSTAASDGDIKEQQQQQQQQRGGRGRGGKSARGSKAHNGTSRAARGRKAKADGKQHDQPEPDQQPKPRGRKRKQQQQQQEEDNAEVAAPQVSGGAAGAGGRVGLTAAQILAAAAPPSPVDHYTDAAHDDADDYLAGLAAASGPGLSDGGVIGFHADAAAQPDYMPTPPESNIGGDVGVDQQQWMQTAATITKLQKAGSVQHQNTAATAMDLDGQFEHDMDQVLLTTNKLTLINTDQLTTATVTPAAAAAAAAASKLPQLLPLGRDQTSKRAALSRPASAADQAQLLSVTAAKDKKSRLSILGGGSKLADMPKLPTGLRAAAAGGAGNSTKALNQRIIQQLLAAGDDSDDDDGCDSDAEGDDHDQVHATVSLGAQAYGLPGLNNSSNALQYMSASAEGGNAAAAGGGGGDAAMVMQLLMALKDEDDDNDNEEIAVLQAALARMLTAKRQQAQRRQQALIQEVQQAVFGRVNDLESALSAELQGLAAAGSARMSELSAGLKGKMQEINSVKDKFETELQSLWQQYAELHGQLTTVQEEVCRQSEDKRRAFKRKLAALHQEAGRVFEAAEKRLACSRPSTMGRHMPALAGLLRAG